VKETDQALETLPVPSNKQVASITSRYQLLGELGRGGMGVVYRAHHCHLDKPVAVKVIKPGVDQARFLREARLLAKVTSPFVVTVHDFDVLPDGSPILVMELLKGHDLRQIIEEKKGPLDEATTIQWMRQTAAGLLAAAEQGIIHRDVKPSNIHIDDLGRARVMDFGLSRSDGDNAGLTVGDSWLGTPFYMAPEQAENPRGVDTRADIYSFGATFYHALTGHLPFPGETSFEVLFKHKTEPLVPPGTYNEQLSNVTCEFLQRCLAKKPRQRFDSFSDVVRFLGPSTHGTEDWNTHSRDDIAEHLERFKTARNVYLQRRLSPRRVDAYLFPGDRRLEIVLGDIVQEHVGAIVSPDNAFLTMNYGCAGAISDAAGPDVGKLASEFGPVMPGRIIVTPGGNLRSRFVFHAVTVMHRRMAYNDDQPIDAIKKLITSLVSGVFYHAQSLDVRSIAVPLTGAGGAGLDEGMVLDALFELLAQRLQRGDTCVQKVRLVLYSDAVADRSTKNQDGVSAFPSPEVLTWACPLSRRDLPQ
jgi:eukaryotic-like serine/threonine-protein kinase